MFADVMSRVTGSQYRCESAVLRNYRCFAVRDELYPGILPSTGAVVTGTVYFRLIAAIWKRLDLFEGEMYRRETIDVEFADGRIASAQTYVVRPEFAHRLSRSGWSAEAFRDTGKKQFLARYFGFDMLKPPEK